MLLSFASCCECKSCTDGHPAFCDNLALLNYRARDNPFRGETPLGGFFFGQSSFASLTPVKESSVVNVVGMINNREELRLFAPLGCGFQTGAGTVTNQVGATERESLTIIGLGGVGMAVIMVSAR